MQILSFRCFDSNAVLVRLSSILVPRRWSLVVPGQRPAHGVVRLLLLVRHRPRLPTAKLERRRSIHVDSQRELFFVE